jgi:hypothetical protein
MKPIEKELDKLVQMLCINSRCRICGRKAEAMHHIIGRANKLLRYDLLNLMPVCYDCHRRIHDEGLDISKYMSYEIWQYLQNIKNKSYRDLLIFDLHQTEDEFLKNSRNHLKRTLNDRNQI